ncbi:rop guanine nucleotide exchange factor 14-like isoform X2 [Actinidia eriantha]|uniref:rop guanine nucleotide exchange factor 14-like isoform X2 n=1 Tax=Actinidia eriantha TaxID=165200 RepID=UPI0025866214|nr:rop guanine nucleotide exchange factor 14-like isoform X2 [Actinidia eriantha]
MMMRRRLACCTRDREISLDFDEQERITTYNGLEGCILNSHSYENESGTSKGDGCVSDSLDEDASSCSSSNNGFGSFSSHWTMMKRDEQGLDEWEVTESPKHFYVKEKPVYSVQFSDVETMKERFAKLLLGEDITGGRKGLSTALALSNGITNLAASVFGELWKLEPLSEDTKSKWRREMDWLLSPTNYMVELVPAKQHDANGRTMEETLESMVSTEFWYAEGGSRAEGRRQSRRWWLPLPQVPTSGLSETERKKLFNQGKVVHQVFKAAKSINESVLLEMPVPTIIKDALPKSGKASLGEELYRILSAESISAEEMIDSLNLKSEHSALETINRLEAAVLAWKDRIAEQSSGKSPVRTSWSFIKDPISEMDKMEFLLDQAEDLARQLKTRYPNLAQTFLDVVKIQYGKDVGHSILEAYSRVLRNLAFKILSRIGDILQEDILSNPNSPVPPCCFPGVNLTGNSDSPVLGHPVRHSLIDQMNKVDEQFYNSYARNNASDLEIPCAEPKTSSVTATPSRSRVWCIGREACRGISPQNSP